MLSDNYTTICEITEESITRLIDSFYGKVRTDPELGPVFERKIAPDQWSAHFLKMYAFWSQIMLGTRRYKGNPILKHAAIPNLLAPMFERWLSLFGETAQEIFSPHVAAEFQQKADRIAESLKLCLFR
jgi:hemoglobin